MKTWTALVVLFLLSGCSMLEPPLPPAPIVWNTPPPTNTPGSLWNRASGDIVADLKARREGDILTVAIYENASASKEASTSTGRSSSVEAGMDNFFGLDENILGLASVIDLQKLVNSHYTNDFNGSGTTTRKEDLVATLTARVVQVLPNGNLRISGSKTVTVNREDQLISLAGEVRPADISSGNTIDSKYILDARIAYTGNGVISDKQGQGWMTRVLDSVWPF